MEPTNLYSYSCTQRQPSPGNSSVRHTSANQNSSAFSASANPDEDWTQISDLAERRRIQNRIAQRNYRKKLKRRLEDLEKRNVSSSTSPEQVPRQPSSGPSSRRQTVPSMRVQARRSVSQSSSVYREASMSPEILQGEEWPESRQPSAPEYAFSLSAPITYSCSSYPPSTEYFTDSDYSSIGYHQIAMTYPVQQCQPGYPQTPLPSTPSMMPYDNMGMTQTHTPADVFTPLDMTFASLNGIDVPNTQAAEEYGLRTPALTDSMSYFGSSRECSPSYLDRCPVSESGSMSPNMHVLQI